MTPFIKLTRRVVKQKTEKKTLFSLFYKPWKLSLFPRDVMILSGKRRACGSKSTSCFVAPNYTRYTQDINQIFDRFFVFFFFFSPKERALFIRPKVCCRTPPPAKERERERASFFYLRFSCLLISFSSKNPYEDFGKFSFLLLAAAATYLWGKLKRLLCFISVKVYMK